MANESPEARKKRLAERKRVDEYYAKGQRERAAAKKPDPPATRARDENQTGVQRMVKFFQGKW